MKLYQQALKFCGAQSSRPEFEPATSKYRPLPKKKRRCGMFKQEVQIPAK